MLKKLFLSLCILCSLPLAMLAMFDKAEASTDYKLEMSTAIEPKIAQILARALLQESIIENELDKAEVNKIVHFANFDDYSAKALMALSVDIVYNDSLKKDVFYIKNSSDNEVYTYTARADFPPSVDIISQMQDNITKNLLLYRLTQIEKDKEELFKDIQAALNLIDNAKGHSQAIEIATQKIELLETLDYLADVLSEDRGEDEKTWAKPEKILERLAKMQDYASLPVSIQNTLAEIYLYVGRTQKTLEILENIYKKTQNANLFTEYLTILTALQRNEIALAKSDMEKVKMILQDENALYIDFILPYFYVLEGAIAQTQEDFLSMCKAYEEACFHKHCAPYFAVQDICNK